MLVVDISVALHDYIFVMAGHLWTLYFDGGGLFIVWHLHGLYISYNTTVVLLIIGRISSQPTNQWQMLMSALLHVPKKVGPDECCALV